MIGLLRNNNAVEVDFNAQYVQLSLNGALLLESGKADVMEEAYPAVYMFIGIKPKDKAEIPGLHSPIYQFDDGVLANASSVFAMLGYQGCMGMLENS